MHKSHQSYHRHTVLSQSKNDGQKPWISSDRPQGMNIVPATIPRETPNAMWTWKGKSVKIMMSRGAGARDATSPGPRGSPDNTTRSATVRRPQHGHGLDGGFLSIYRLLVRLHQRRSTRKPSFKIWDFRWSRGLGGGVMGALSLDPTVPSYLGRN